MFWKTINVADHQKVLVYRDDRLEQVLAPGRHKISMWTGVVHLETYDCTKVYFYHDRAKFLCNTYAELLDDHLQRFEMSDTEVGLLYRDNKLVSLLAPANDLTVWKGVEDVRVEVIDIRENLRIDENLLFRLQRLSGSTKAAGAVNGVLHVEIADDHVGLLSVNGKLEQLLDAGRYGFWSYNRNLNCKVLDLRVQSLDVSGQEILTKDRVSLRINLSASFQYRDVRLMVNKLKDYSNYIYQQLQLRLREAVGTRTLDELLEDKNVLNQVIVDGTRERLAEYGIALLDVGVKDIILPGDMKAILNQVVEAEKQAEANLIKRREETQAMRALHNTAKMMDNNPVLMRLKELEALESITARVDKISVYGGLEGLLQDLVKLKNV